LRFSIEFNDVQAKRWHVYEIDVVLEKIVGANGGLVCFVLIRHDIKPVSLIMMNPLIK